MTIVKRDLRAPLQSWLPAWFFIPGLRLRWSQRFTLSNPSLEVDHISGISKGTLLDVAIDHRALLTKTFELPKASPAKTQKAIDLMVRQTMPQKGTGLVWSTLKSTHDQASPTFDVVFIKGQQLKALQSDIESAGYRVRRIFATRQGDDFPSFVDNRKTTDRAPKFWAGLSTAAIVAGAAYAYVDHAKVRSALAQELRQLEASKLKLTAEIVALKETAELAKASSEQTRADATRLKSERYRLHVLTDLTRHLSDATWLSEVSIAGTQLNISGFTSAEVTSVMGQINELPWSTKVELNGPVTFDSFSRKDRFNLSIGLHGDVK